MDKYEDSIRKLKEDQLQKLMTEENSSLDTRFNNESIEKIEKLIDEVHSLLNNSIVRKRELDQNELVKEFIKLDSDISTLRAQYQNLMYQLQQAKEARCNKHLYFMLNEDSNSDPYETTWTYEMSCLFCDKLILGHDRRAPGGVLRFRAKTDNQFEMHNFRSVLKRDALYLKNKGLSNEEIITILKEHESDIRKEAEGPAINLKK
jgi:hypothetical protein